MSGQGSPDIQELAAARAGFDRVLPRRRLGTTDMEITRLGPGAWSFGGGDHSALIRLI